jgi:molybdopterin synthase sulfur carrier subunit
MVTVLIPALLRPLAGGQAMVEAEGATVREVIRDVAARWPKLGEALLEDGRLKSHLRVAVDGAVSPLGLRTATPPGCEVHFVAAISGGRCVPESPIPTRAHPRG